MRACRTEVRIRFRLTFCMCHTLHSHITMLIFPLRYKHSTCCRYCECTMAMISSSTRSHAPRQHLANASCRSPPPVSCMDPTRDALLRASQPTSRIHSRRGDAGAARSKASAGELEQERLRPSKQGRRAGLPALLKRLPAFLWGLPADVGIRGARRFFSAWTATFPTRKFEPRTRTPRPVTHPRAPSSRHRPRLRHRPSPSSSSVSSGGSSGSSVSFFSSV